MKLNWIFEIWLLIYRLYIHTCILTYRFKLFQKSASGRGKKRIRKPVPARGKKHDTIEIRMKLMAKKDATNSLNRAVAGYTMHSYPFNRNLNPEEFKSKLIDTFPPLSKCGYTLMKANQLNKLIPLPEEINTPALIKDSDLCKRSALYIRPHEVNTFNILWIKLLQLNYNQK